MFAMKFITIVNEQERWQQKQQQQKQRSSE